MTVRFSMIGLLLFALTIIAPEAAVAGWRRIDPTAVEVANGGMVAQPISSWNRASKRPAKNGESWTKDGFPLNRLDFFAGIEPGESIYKERSKKHRPLPKFESNMLLPDLAGLFEANFSIENDVTSFEVTNLEPATLGGAQGLLLEYDFALPGGALRRKGEARIAVHKGKLHVVNFTAPKLHYFDDSISEVQAMMDSIKLR